MIGSRRSRRFPRVPGPRLRASGFTLVETLVAMTLAGAVLLPASLWLYGSRASRMAREHFRATQLLETQLNRALLLRLDRDWSAEYPDPGYLRLEIRPVRAGAETRLLGSARDRKGRTVTRLEAAYFGGGP